MKKKLIYLLVLVFGFVQSKTFGIETLKESSAFYLDFFLTSPIDSFSNNQASY
jgi:hypothetical protein